MSLPAPSSSLIGKRQKALLHVAKAKLGLTEEVYRDILQIHGGVQSSVDLDWTGYRRVKRHLGTLGFSTKGPHPGADVPHRSGFASGRQIRMIEGLWADLSFAPVDRRKAALREFMWKRFGVSDLRFLSSEGAGKVLTALLAMVKDKGRKETRTWET